MVMNLILTDGFLWLNKKTNDKSIKIKVERVEGVEKG
jgi:hypothetical protein